MRHNLQLYLTPEMRSQGRCLTRRAPCLPNPSSLQSWEHEVSRERQAKGERPSGRWERAESDCRRLGEGRRFTSRPRVRTGEGETVAGRESGDRERASGSCLQRPVCGGWDGSKEGVVRVRASPATPYNSPNKVVMGMAQYHILDYWRRSFCRSPISCPQ